MVGSEFRGASQEDDCGEIGERVDSNFNIPLGAPKMLASISRVSSSLREKIVNINPAVLGIILFSIFIIINLPSYNCYYLGGDAAEYINNPLRVLNNEMPYRDFWLLFPPGEVFVPYFTYKAFGLNINNILLLRVLISAITGLAAFILGRSLYKDNFFSSLLALIIFVNSISGIWQMLIIVSATFLISYILYPKNISLFFFSGLAVGLAFLFDFAVVTAVFCSFGLTIIVYSRINNIKVTRCIYMLLLFAAGPFVVLSFAYLALSDIWGAMVYAVTIDALSHGTRMKLPYFYSAVAILRDLAMPDAHGLFYKIARAIRFLPLFILYMALYVMPFFLLGVSIWYWCCGKLTKTDKSVMILFLLWGVSVFPKALGRSDIDHLRVSLMALFPLLVFFVWKIGAQFQCNGRMVNASIKYCLLGAIAITLLGGCYNLFYNNISSLSMLWRGSKPVSTEYGHIILDKDQSELVKSIEKYSNDGDYIFVTAWSAPPLYALTNRRNPTYYDSLIDLIARPSEAKQRGVCNALLSKDTKLVIHQADFGFDNKDELTFANTCPILQKCIDDNFTIVERYDDYLVYLPKLPREH